MSKLHSAGLSGELETSLKIAPFCSSDQLSDEQRVGNLILHHGTGLDRELVISLSR